MCRRLKTRAAWLTAVGYALVATFANAWHFHPTPGIHAAGGPTAALHAEADCSDAAHRHSPVGRHAETHGSAGEHGGHHHHDSQPHSGAGEPCPLDHDQGCAVCRFLAQSPSLVAPVSPPSAAGLVATLLLRFDPSPAADVTVCYCSRAPPV